MVDASTHLRLDFRRHTRVLDLDQAFDIHGVIFDGSVAKIEDVHIHYL